MDPSEFADEELDLWQAALQEQRDAERMAEEARAAGDQARLTELLPLIDRLRLAADLMLAEAVSIKCAYRHSMWSKLNPFR